MPRDLKADLEICEAMSGRRWYVKKRGAHPAIYADDGAPVATVSNSAQSRFPEQRIANAEGIAAAREGWPEAIRRALEAEKRVRILEQILRAMGVTPNDQAILERHLGEMTAGEEG